MEDYEIEIIEEGLATSSMRSHGDKQAQRRSKIWIPVVIVVVGVMVLLAFVVLDQISHEQSQQAETPPVHSESTGGADGREAGLAISFAVMPPLAGSHEVCPLPV